jgi:hypothetical protein
MTGCKDRWGQWRPRPDGGALPHASARSHPPKFPTSLFPLENFRVRSGRISLFSRNGIAVRPHREFADSALRSHAEWPSVGAGAPGFAKIACLIPCFPPRVVAGLVPATPRMGAPCPPERDRRDKPGAVSRLVLAEPRACRPPRAPLSQAMSKPTPSTRPSSAEAPGAKAARREARAERLSAALKANLRRRKAQARERAAADDPASHDTATPTAPAAPGAPAGSHDSAGIAEDKRSG